MNFHLNKLFCRIGSLPPLTSAIMSGASLGNPFQSQFTSNSLTLCTAQYFVSRENGNKKVKFSLFLVMGADKIMIFENWLKSRCSHNALQCVHICHAL